MIQNIVLCYILYVQLCLYIITHLRVSIEMSWRLMKMK